MNSNDFYRISDNVYSLNGFTHLMFHSKITDIDAINGKTKSYYNEYKTKNTKVGSVLIKRKLEYFFTLEYSYKGDKNSAMIIADQMYEVIDKFQYIRNTWFNPKNSYKVFGLVNEHLVVIDSRESIIIRCLCDKYIRLDPAIYKSDNGDKPALNLYIGDSTFPILIQSEKFIGMVYILSTMDMANFANTSLSLATLRTEPHNRVSFQGEETVVNKPTDIGKAGRDFKCRQNNNLI